MKIEKPTINKQRHRAQTDKRTRAHRHNNKKQRSQSHARLAPLRHRQFGSTGPIDLLHSTPSDDLKLRNFTEKSLSPDRRRRRASDSHTLT